MPAIRPIPASYVSWNAAGQLTLASVASVLIKSGGALTAVTFDGAQDATFQGNVFLPANKYVSWLARSGLDSPADGLLRLTNAAGTGFDRLQFGSTAATHPAIKRSSTALHARLADDSGYAPTESLYDRWGAGTPEGVVTAPIGSTFHRTDGGAGTSLYVKQSGVGNTGWVGK